jgi:hypothetical protein
MINFQQLAPNISNFFLVSKTQVTKTVCLLHHWYLRAALTAPNPPPLPPTKIKPVAIMLRNTDNIKCKKNVFLVHNKSDFSASYSKTIYYTLLLEQCHQLHDFSHSRGSGQVHGLVL